MTKESKEKMSRAKKGKPLNAKQAKHLRKIQRANNGRIFSKEWRKKIGDANRGHKMSKEQKKQIRESNKKRYANGEKFGFQKGNGFGVRFKKGNPGLKGAKNPRWKGGLGFVNPRRTREYGEWRQKVWERDGFTCQKCGQVGKDLNAHHILSFSEYPEYMFIVDNGITFCEKCHREFHKTYGYKNITKQQLNDFKRN